MRIHVLFIVVLLIAVVPLAKAFEIKGKVLDLEMKPIIGATVWFYQESQASVTKANASGEYSFSDANVGYASLIARKIGYAIGGSNALIVGDGTLDLVLGEADSVQLRIIDHAYQPIAGARICRMSISELFYVNVDRLAELGFPTYRSDEEGHLTISELPKGGYLSFTASHRKYADYTMPYFSVGEKLDIALADGVEISGRIKDVNGKGLAEARVVISHAGSTMNQQYVERFTDPEGFYRSTVSPGLHFIAVKHKNYASPPAISISAKGPEALGVDDIHMLPPHKVQGKVLDDKKKPLGAVVVSYLYDGKGYDMTHTSLEGRYSMIVPQGEGTVHVLPPDGFMTENVQDIEVKVEQEEEISISDIKLIPMPEITGKVVDENGEPVTNALISSVGLELPVWTLTDENGQFSILLSRMPENAKVTFRLEHSLRFLREEFKVNLKRTSSKLVKLINSYEPDLHECKVKEFGNDLVGMRGKPAPEISCDGWFNSEGVTLEELRGKVVVLTLWGGFDRRGPSEDRLYELNCLSDMLRDVDDVSFIAVHDSSRVKTEIEEYVKMYGILYPVGCDAEPALTFDTYNTNTIPQTVLIDKKGILRYFDVDGRLLELIKSLRRE